jgi:hypothetical protein
VRRFAELKLRDLLTIFNCSRKTLQGSNSQDDKDVPQIKEGLLNVKIISINGRVRRNLNYVCQ